MVDMYFISSHLIFLIYIDDINSSTTLLYMSLWLRLFRQLVQHRDEQHYFVVLRDMFKYFVK